MIKKNRETPLMLQYYSVKKKHSDALLLFRVGDFYETFGKDAIKVSNILNIVLTERAGIELAGFPYHSLDTYLPKLVKAGERVAICEQLEDPKKTKKLVKRGVTELVTPGISISEKVLDNNKNNYLAGVFFDKKENIAIALVDYSTGEFVLSEGNKNHIINIINTFSPSEIIYPKSEKEKLLNLTEKQYYIYPVDDWIFEYNFNYQKLTEHFDTKNLKGFGIEELSGAISAGGAVIHYLQENKHTALKHINKVRRIEQDKYVWLDKFTINNLELLSTNQENSTSLVEIINNTKTPMGARLLRKWIFLPLKNIDAINKRHEMVDFFYENEQIAQNVNENLSKIGDLERLVSKIATKKINPREVKHIEKALIQIEKIKEILKHKLPDIEQKLNSIPNLKEKIQKTIVDEPPYNLAKGGAIKEGIDQNLDEYRNASKSGKNFLDNILKAEIKRTGISSLKIGFNNVFGYYLEVTNKYKKQVPTEWNRKQTLTNSERYITQELKDYENKIISAEGKILELENQLFEELITYMTQHISQIQQNSINLAFYDVLISFADIAKKNNYKKPTIDESLIIDIKNGRHPVIEQKLPPSEEYIPNDIYLNNDNQQVIILTGPNMSGKSALLRQIALIVLMGQMGSYVPAEKARIGMVDKIFTRVGASDNLSLGESTFMVEMIETATILNNLSQRSLILLDEIGRGTSTYDGVSIAWAITEYLHQSDNQPKTVFATHYHELNELTDSMKRIKNFNVSVREYNDKIIFLRKLQKGGSEHSFAINVAKLAGVPNYVTKRAEQILSELEKQRTKIKGEDEKINPKEPLNIKLKVFDNENQKIKKIEDEINKININAMTPIEAIIKLRDLQEMLKD